MVDDIWKLSVGIPSERVWKASKGEQALPIRDDCEFAFMICIPSSEVLDFRPVRDDFVLQV